MASDSCISGAGLIGRCIDFKKIRNDTDVPGDNGQDVINYLNNQVCTLAHTGWLNGGITTPNVSDDTAIDIFAGEGWFVNPSTPLSPICIRKAWNAQTVIIPDIETHDLTGVFVDSAGVIGFREGAAFVPEDYRNFVILASVGHAGGTVNHVQVRTGQVAYNGVLTFFDYIRTVTGPATRSGNVYSANGANLNVNKSPGETFFPGAAAHTRPLVPDITEDPSASPASLVRVFNTQAGDGVTTDTPTGTFDLNPNGIDDGSGMLGAAGLNKYTVQICYFSPDELTGGVTSVAYGQEQFNTFAVAKAALLEIKTGLREIVEPPQLRAQARRMFLIIQQGTTDLAAAIAGSSAEFIRDRNYRIE